MTKEAMERPDVEGIEAKLRVADNFIESEAILSEIARSVVPELCDYILVLEENALDREVDILALETRLALLEAVRKALEALGVMPEGYCFCAYERDPLKDLKGIPHTGECGAARSALAAHKGGQP